MQYHSKATDTVCSIKLKREEFLYIRTIINFQAECILTYMFLFYQISAWVFLIHMFLYACSCFYCMRCLFYNMIGFPRAWIEKVFLCHSKKKNLKFVSTLFKRALHLWPTRFTLQWPSFKQEKLSPNDGLRIFKSLA